MATPSLLVWRCRCQGRGHTNLGDVAIGTHAPERTLAPLTGTTGRELDLFGKTSEINWILLKDFHWRWWGRLNTQWKDTVREELKTEEDNKRSLVSWSEIGEGDKMKKGWPTWWFGVFCFYSQWLCKYNVFGDRNSMVAEVSCRRNFSTGQGDLLARDKCCKGEICPAEVGKVHVM